ncbi:hypothetical protein ACJX0J_002903, partial (mitochondrion) [Zea mays]
MGAKRMIFVRARNKNNSDWPFILEFFHANLFHTNIVDVMGRFALANQLEDRYILTARVSSKRRFLCGFSAIIGAYKVHYCIVWSLVLIIAIMTTDFNRMREFWNLSYYLIIISFIKYHMKNSESILYMVFGTSLYLETQDISDIVIFNNMAIVGVSLGIVIAFCVAIGLYSRYRSDCLLLWILIRNYQEEFRVTNRILVQALVVSEAATILASRLKSSKKNKATSISSRGINSLSELKVLWQAFKYEVSVLLRSFFPFATYFIDYSEINTSHNLLFAKGQITIQNKLALLFSSLNCRLDCSVTCRAVCIEFSPLF